MIRTIDEMALLLKKHNITVPASTRKPDHREETEEHEDTHHALKLVAQQHMPSSLILELPIIWLHPENHSLPYSLLMVLVFKWEISQVQHLTTYNIIFNSNTWNNSLQQVFFQEGKIYNHLQVDLYVQKFHIHLLSNTLVSKIDPKK